MIRVKSVGRKHAFNETVVEFDILTETAPGVKKVDGSYEMTFDYVMAEKANVVEEIEKRLA